MLLRLVVDEKEVTEKAGRATGAKAAAVEKVAAAKRLKNFMVSSWVVMTKSQIQVIQTKSREDTRERPTDTATSNGTAGKMMMEMAAWQKHTDVEFSWQQSVRPNRCDHD